jgi:hypothetical protein
MTNLSQAMVFDLRHCAAAFGQLSPVRVVAHNLGGDLGYVIGLYRVHGLG